MDEEGAAVSSLLLLIRFHPSLTCEGELHNRVARPIRLPFSEFCWDLVVPKRRKLATPFT